MENRSRCLDVYLVGNCPGPDGDLVSVNLVPSKPVDLPSSRTTAKLAISSCEGRDGTKCLLSKLNLSCPFVEEVV